MFWGSHDHVLDDKGRTSLPKEFRDALARLKGTPWITLYPDCVAILPATSFEELRERLTAGELGEIDSIQHLKRLIIGMASPCTVDRQGRISIPTKLRTEAGLGRELVFTGVGDRIEIWDRAKHASELERVRLHYPEYTRDLKRSSP